jgi:hypothetical protein
MGYLGSYKCAGIIFDMYDIERVSIDTTGNKYYITPCRLIEAQKWMLEKNIEEIVSVEDMEELIDKDIIGIY